MREKSLDLDHKTILVTGAAGFIGSNLCLRLLKRTEGARIIGVDNMNMFNPIELKEWRLNYIGEIAQRCSSEWMFREGDISDKEFLDWVMQRFRPAVVVNLAAQEGVGYSIENPYVYMNSNMVGFLNVLEGCRNYPVEHLVFATSASADTEVVQKAFPEEEYGDHPVSFYAASKRSNELMAHSYARLYGIPVTGLRLYTVYGPFGRTDMAYFAFADRLYRGETLSLYNHGENSRDFTYINDVIEAIFRVLQSPPERRLGEDGLPRGTYRMYNIGSGQPRKMREFLKILQGEMIAAGVLPEDFDAEEQIEYLPLQPGETPQACADISAMARDFGWTPSTDLREGLSQFAAWFKEYAGNIDAMLEEG